MRGNAASSGLEQLATGVALVDAELRVRWVNAALAELLGSGMRSAVGQPLALWLCSPENLAQVQRALDEARFVQLREAALSAFDERTLKADLAIQPADDGGLLVEVHALAASAPAVSPLSATLRGFAHEVKNPLAGLRGAAQLLQRRVDGAARLGTVNIHELLDRLAELMRAEPAPPRLRHDYDPSLPDVWGDADQLQQVLLNLARNAVEAGGRTLTLRTRAEHGVRAGARVLRCALRVDVVDDGPGVPAELRDT